MIIKFTKPNDNKASGIISSMLDSPEGRRSLAQLMVSPIARALEYQAIGRRLLLVDELPSPPIVYLIPRSNIISIINNTKCQ